MPQEWQRASDPAGYLSTRTIAALCSPTGGAICVLRISGEQALKIAEKITHLKIESSQMRFARRVWLRSSSGKKMDDAMMVAFQNPSSFTGEDVVEFFLHGSPMIAQKVLDEVFALGARLALPGEFSFRAVKNGKLTLSQAEAVKEVIAAENDFALDLALEKLSGSQHEHIQKIKAELMQLITLSEVGIDFSDQDIDEVSLPRLRERLRVVQGLLSALYGSFDRGKRFVDGVPVSIFGLPNAGKSSFFNAILGEDRSIVSDIAGTTRDVVREKINLKGSEGYTAFRVSDTAGLRKSADVIEEIGIERSIKAAIESDLILLVIDGADPRTQEVIEFLKSVPREGKMFLGVLTKQDLISPDQKTATEKTVQTLGIQSWTWISSKTLVGIHEVAEKMTSVAANQLKRAPGEVLLTRVEHVEAVKIALAALDQASRAEDLALFAADVRHGMNALGPLIGETLPDDVLGKIFSDFCIGK